MPRFPVHVLWHIAVELLLSAMSRDGTFSDYYNQREMDATLYIRRGTRRN